MGITAPTLYTFFGNKKQLFMEAVDRYQNGPGCFAKAALLEEPTAESSMRRLLMEASIAFSNPAGPKGCMVVLAATNCGAESSDVYLALANRRRAAERVVRDRIAAGQKAGELQEDADIDALTGVITATLYGLAIKARDGASRATLRRIVEQTMHSWPHRGD
jgi:AcrR family transcriptional regulator